MDDGVVGPFRILRTLGEGGMGVVYAARDERLGRTVALKRVRPASDDPTARERIWREARAGASITHPNVCQVYDVLEQDGDLYVAMELLEGEPLADRVARGAIPTDEALRMAGSVLRALEALHAKGLVHRDVKPSNVFLTPHGVKVLDFGLAAPIAAGRDGATARLTATGLFVGTPGYMAPEQWTGEPVGPASDLFAVGAVLFEALTGRPAFEGKSAIEIFHAAAYGQVPALSGGPTASAIDRVLQRAMAKDPKERFATAAEMARALDETASASTLREAPRVRAVTRVIVLPFRMLRPDPELDFLCLALPEAIATSLASQESIVVRSPHVASRFGGATPDLAALAAEAEVDVALAGTLHRGGDRLRVSAQLLEAPGGTVRWSDTSQVALGDLFTLQDDLARRIVESLEIPLRGGSHAALQRDVPASPKAYEAYLKGNQLGQRQSLLADAKDLYLACLKEDPRYAPAWARLGRVYRIMAKYGQGGADYLPKAEEAFRKALSLNPDLASAHSLFTYFEIEEMGRPRDAMTRLLERCRRHGNEAELYSGLVVALRFCGLLEASVEAHRRSHHLDPTVRTSVAYTHWMRGDYEAAIRSDDEDMPWVRLYSLPLLGREAEAVLLGRTLEDTPASPLIKSFGRSTRGAIERDRDACVSGVAPLLASNFHDPEGFYFSARNLARVGEGAQALDLLARVVRSGFTCPTVLRRDPWLEGVRGAPEFAALLREAETARALAAEAYRAAGGERLLGPLVEADRA